jgi:hypothetical protein
VPRHGRASFIGLVIAEIAGALVETAYGQAMECLGRMSESR